MTTLVFNELIMLNILTFNNKGISQPAFVFSKSAMETPEHCMEFFQS